MIEINQVRITRILNPTAIDLGEYVINPFMGCEYNCVYCYVRTNRVVSKRNKPWGSFVDIRINAPALLEKELAKKKPKTVLLGSTTECFQPSEKKFGITRRILEILNQHGVYYVILTRSPFITEYLALLRAGYCKRIYFTVNEYGQDYKHRLEPKSPAFSLRDQAVNLLLSSGLAVVPYFSPVLPWISKVDDVFKKYPLATGLEFECLNFALGHREAIINALSEGDQILHQKYTRMSQDKKYYYRVWEELNKKISRLARVAKKDFKIYIHDFADYFKNRYE
jgi:DNA repair photolyase